ncbi:MAG: FeS assembly protein SufB [Candidatus Woesebacteria bacterium GW2011_GWA1_37_7]|uniref:FeS assembly protein SufB n=1 Tax=Candidatus Woesebacteria bacterium GW2011_GWA1_37_7 TaxID=1618545 RepID=A0A0G0H201_9BACT|nr:MAG: FeS assembly protein SufB [Candidatus Woesebacteria bacterium GW2011_GWA1_37_7]
MGIQINENYKTRFGFNVPQYHVFKTEKGLSEQVIAQISQSKQEPAWMNDFRLKAYKTFQEKVVPTWGGDLSEIDFDEIYYFLKPTDKEERRWEDVPAEMKETFERLGVPQAEREYLAGVKAQFDSSVIYSSLLNELKEQGIIFERHFFGCKGHIAARKFHNVGSDAIRNNFFDKTATGT